MTGHTYLMKSRHGVYYLRLVVRPAADAPEGTKSREIRLSLRTKKKCEAKARLVETLFEVQRCGGRPERPRMPDDDDRERLFYRGLTLMDRHGEFDPHDEFNLGTLLELMSHSDVEAYIFAYDHIERQKALDKERQERLLAAARSSLGCAMSNVLPSVRDEACEPRSSPGSSGSPQSRHRSRDAVDDITITDAVARFIEHKTTANAATSEKYRSQCLLFIKLIGGSADRRLSSLNADDIRRYTDNLRKLPKKIAPTDPRSVEDLLLLDGPRLAPKTVFSHARAVNMFLEWCADQSYPVSAPFAGILKPLLKKPKSPEKEKAFTLNELKTIFGSQRYREGRFRSQSEYWLPLLALFTGARQGELCQLHRDDVRRDEKTGIWIFDINERGDKKLKQASSRRQVPIHSKLLELGFLDYHAAAKASEAERLFPDLERNPRGEFNAYSKRFNRFLDELGIRSSADAKKDFHSFRHSLSGRLIEQGDEEYVVNAIIGHSQAGRSESVRTYSNGVCLETKRHVIEKVVWDIDFARIAELP